MTNWDQGPAGMVARLDDSLQRAGEDAVLRRPVGTALVPVDVVVRIRLRGYDPAALAAPGMQQQDQKFILSPTQIDAAQWPGGQPEPVQGPGSALPVDPRVPRLNDILLTRRGKLTVQAAAGLYAAGVLVRIEGRARGQ